LVLIYGPDEGLVRTRVKALSTELGARIQTRYPSWTLMQKPSIQTLPGFSTKQMRSACSATGA